jgi:hypothetical protein
LICKLELIAIHSYFQVEQIQRDSLYTMVTCDH